MLQQSLECTQTSQYRGTNVLLLTYPRLHHVSLPYELQEGRVIIQFGLAFLGGRRQVLNLLIQRLNAQRDGFTIVVALWMGEREWLENDEMIK